MKERKHYLPLQRFRVLDLTRVRAGPTAVRQLADWGAHVIKIEAPAHIDKEAGMGGDRHGPDFQNLHRNKRSMTLNLKEPRGYSVFMDLVDRTDVVVENFRPDVKSRLGIDYETLKLRNSQIILASISGFGQDGPYANRPGFDQIAQGMGGLMSITGFPGHGPVRVGVPIADLASGLYAAIGILIALLQREETGRGQWVHTSLLQAQIAMLDFQAARWLIAHELPKQAGNNHPTSTPTGVYDTTDGQMTVAASGEIMWSRLCDVLDAYDLLTDANYASEELRYKHRDSLNAKLNSYFKKNKTSVWISLLNNAGIPCGSINTIDEVFMDPQVEHLGMAKTVSHASLGDIELLNNPIEMSEAPVVEYTSSPDRGEHTHRVLEEYGYSKREIKDLERSGII